MECVGFGRLYREAAQQELSYEHALLGPPERRGHWASSHRHVTGAFYTPPHLVRFVVDKTLLPSLEAIRHEALGALQARNATAWQQVMTRATALQVVDPACGCGRFLLAAFRILRNLHVWLAKRDQQFHMGPCDYRELGARRALSCLYGIDLNRQAVVYAQAVLQQAAGFAGQEMLIELKQNIRVQDALTSQVQPQSWSAVIGNPPWGALGAGATARRMGLPVANANTFALFVMHCLETLAPEGRLGFVLPRNFCKGNDYAHMREHLLHATALEWLGDAGVAFPGVAQEVVVVVVRRLKPGEKSKQTNLVHIPADGNGVVLLRRVEQQSFCQAPGAVLTLHADATAFAVLRQMEEAAQGKTLRDWVSWVRGIEYGQDGALICCAACGGYTSLPKKKQAHKVCARCGCMLTADAPVYRLIVHNLDEAHTVPIYVGRHVRRYRLAAPYWVDPAVPGVQYKDTAAFQGPKILVPKIAPFLAAALDTTQAWTTQGVYILRPTKRQWGIHSLLGLLNSAPLAFYYQFRFNDSAKLTTNVTLQNLLNLPVPVPDEHLMAQAEIDLGCRKLMKRTCAVDQVELRLDQAVASLFRLSEDAANAIKTWRQSERR